MSNQATHRKPKFISSIISVAFVLFSLGLLVFLLVKSKQLIKTVKERVEVNVFLNDKANENSIDSLSKVFETKAYYKSQTIISKEDARKEFGETFEMDFLDYNPLPASINLYLNAQYANTDSLQVIEDDLKKSPLISDVFYQKELLNLVNTNVQKIGVVLGVIALFLAIMAMTLIDNSIRLSLFSQRFLIKSMQLVGAKDSFILKPFIQQGIINGLLSSLIALGLLALLNYFTNSFFPIIQWPEDKKLMINLTLGLVGVGIIMTVFATWISVKKYLNSKIEDLY